MKKLMTVTLVLVSAVVLAATNRALKYKEDTSNGSASCTNYYGYAWSTSGSPTPSVNDAVWKIVRTVLDSQGNVIDYTHAFADADNELWSNTWTNRVNATYK